MAIVVLDTLGQVDVTSELLTVDGAEEGAEDRDLAAALNGEGNVLGRVREVCEMLEYVTDDTDGDVVAGGGSFGGTYHGHPSGSCHPGCPGRC